MAGVLYIVATPIGNLDDLSPRAVSVLKKVNVIACEDTRHTRKLLAHFGIDTGTVSLHEHNEESRSRQLVDQMLEGREVALVSDAGTPLLSDPGYRLVRSCRESGLKVLPIPGPFAGAAAVSVSGLPTDRILFLGFLTRKSGPAKKILEEAASVHATLVIYLSPHRLLQTLRQIESYLGNRPAFLIREMTKIFETGYVGTLSEIREQISGKALKGEFTLVVAGPGEEPEDQEDSDRKIDAGAYVRGLMETRGISSREAIRLAFEQLGGSKKEIYRAYLDVRKEHADGRKNESR